MSAELERYRAAVERVRALVMRHVEAGRPGARPEILAELSRVIERMERHLAATVDGARDSRLAMALGLRGDEVGFLWTVVAVGTDPRIAPHLAQLGAEQRAATIALHARIDELPGERAVALGLSLGPAHPLLRHRLLIAHDAVAPASGTWQAPHRLAAYLAGDDTIDPDLLDAAVRVVPPADLLVDEGTAAAHARLARVLAGGDVVAVVDGGPGAGRRTAVAVAAGGRPVIALDVAHLAPGPQPLERALRRWRARPR